MRSSHVSPPDLWGLLGGQVPLKMRTSVKGLRKSALKEFKEEVGFTLNDKYYTGKMMIFPDMDVHDNLNDNENILSEYTEAQEEEQYHQYCVFLYEIPRKVLNLPVGQKMYPDPDLSGA